MCHLRKIGATLLLTFVISLSLPGKERSVLMEVFDSVTVHIDTLKFTYPKDSIVWKNRSYLGLFYQEESPSVEIHFYKKAEVEIDTFSLLPSKSYDLRTPLIYIKDYYLADLRLLNITTGNFLKVPFQLQLKSDSMAIIDVLNIFPYTETKVDFRPLTDELFIGEEKGFEVLTNRPENIVLQNMWSQGNDIDYRITESFGQARIHLLPNKSGKRQISIPIATKKPNLRNGKPVFALDTIKTTFNVKKSRLQFLNLDKREITLNEKNRSEGFEVQIDYSPLLAINKTYRIENSEKRGSTLVGEIFTRDRLGNNKVLCKMRVYNYHQKGDGYLYIKDGDKPRFITNVDITPKMHIDKVSVLHKGLNWTQSLNVYPGEVVFIRIEGQGLHKAKFHIEDVPFIAIDSNQSRENVIDFKVSIPVDVEKRTITIFNNNKLTGYALHVVEHQTPKSFDYIYVDYGGKRKLSGVRGPLVYFPTIKDVEFSFLDFKLDSYEKQYGKQYLKMDIIIKDKNDKLLEIKTIDNIVICPSDKSPRYEYYNKSDCSKSSLSLNNHLRTKTYELPEWSKMYIKVENKSNKYKDQGKTKEIEVIQGRKYKFDVELSFPAGLITIYKQPTGEVDENGNEIEKVDFGSLGGISMAMIAQYSFYNLDKIARYRPYKIGAGFIALNAFNFADDKDQDLGMVILGSVYPTTKETRLTFPLYLGGGYLLKAGRPFFLVGPGIRVKL